MEELLLLLPLLLVLMLLSYSVAYSALTRPVSPGPVQSGAARVYLPQLEQRHAHLSFRADMPAFPFFFLTFFFPSFIRFVFTGNQ